MAIAAVLTLVPAAAVAAPEPPSGPWHVVYENERCIATRDYGSGPTERLLIFKPSASGKVMQIFFVEAGKGKPDQEPGTLQLGSGPSWPVSVLVYGEKTTRKLVALVNVPMEDFKTRSDSSFVGLDSKKTSHELATPGLAKVMAALEKCQVDLQNYWNIGPAGAGQVAQSAVPARSLASYFSPNDYPDIALWQKQGGKVVLGLLIDETGKIAECSIETTSGIASLDANSCATMRERAEFSPARNQAGQAIRSHMIVPILWLINN